MIATTPGNWVRVVVNTMESTQSASSAISAEAC